LEVCDVTVMLLPPLHLGGEQEKVHSVLRVELAVGEWGRSRMKHDRRS